MKTIKFLLPAIVILLSINKSSAQLYSATDSMTFTSQNNTVSDWGRGFLFYPNIDIYISKIGKLVPSNTGNYKWAIWDYNNQTIVYQQTSLQSYAGQYIYEPTDSIIKLTANTYYILILYSDSGSYYYDINSSNQLNSNLTYIQMNFCNNCAATTGFPAIDLANAFYGMPDFLFETCIPFDNSTTVSSNVITANQNNASYQWLNCDNNYAPIPGDTNQSFIAQSNGNYACQITYNGCTDTTNCVNINSIVTSVDNVFDKNEQLINIYPNPVTNAFTIKLKNNASVKNITVKDVTGKLIYENHKLNESKLTVDTELWNKGIYFVSYTANGTPYMIKLIKK
tara:strand:- start:60612 stop:61628 length:1017 start_codon:yes stop_codon:yes gene_type:complete